MIRSEATSTEEWMYYQISNQGELQKYQDAVLTADAILQLRDNNNNNRH